MSYNTKNKLRIFAENATPNESTTAGLIYSDATWAENVNRLNGEKKGVAPSIDFNTALKQATLGSTVLGDIIAKRYDIIMSSELQEGATTNYKSFEDYVSDISEKFAFGNLLGSKEVKKSNLADDILKGTFDDMTVGTAKYASADKTKGTIEERLTNLGFKEGSLIFPDILPIIKSADLNRLDRQGNYVLGTLNCQFDTSSLVKYALAFTIPDNFKLNMPLNICCVQANTTGGTAYMLITNTYVVDGIMDYNKFYLVEWANIKADVNYMFQFGYRANPIT